MALAMPPVESQLEKTDGVYYCGRKNGSPERPEKLNNNGQLPQETTSITARDLP